jgi:DNA-binding protein H-NS
MRKLDLEAMNFEELWLLHEEPTMILAEKISAERSGSRSSIARSS